MIALDKLRERAHLSPMIKTRTHIACSYFWAYL